MCGLVGVAGRLAFKDVKVFKELLYADRLRGSDSVGVGIVTGDQIRTLKGPMEPATFLDLKKVDDALKPTANVLMGHNRAATRGKVNVSNAHPWNTGRILGAHNGTLDYSCLKDLENNYEGDTDSEQLINTIHSLGGNIADALALTSGAWALSIYDKEDETINLVRNDQRPLFWCMAESRETVYWASEAHMLRWILARNDIKIKENKIYDVPVNTILSFAVPMSNGYIFQEKPARRAAPGKRVQNFQRGPVGVNYEQTGWENWLEDRNGPSSDQKGSAAKSGTSSSSTYNVGQKRSRRTDVPEYFYTKPNDDDVYWEVWGLGYVEGSTPAARFTSPFVIVKDLTEEAGVYNPRYHEAYREAWAIGISERNKPEQVNIHMAKAKINKLIEKPADNKVTEPLLLKAGEPSKSPVGQLVDLAAARKAAEPKKEVKVGDVVNQGALKYPGPNGRKISLGKFTELTGCKCGWCEGDVTPDTDNGKFVELETLTIVNGDQTVRKTEQVYACEDCLTDPVQADYIKDAQKKA